MSHAISSPPITVTGRDAPATSHAPSARRWSNRTVGSSLRELVLMVTVFMAYRQVRHLTSGDLAQAHANADRVVNAERQLGIFSENALQRLVLNSRPVIEFLDHYYVFVHFTASLGFMAWVFLRHPEAWGRIRAWFLSVTLAGLAIHVAYPLAPPRMLSQHGFVDTLHVYGPSIYSKDVTESAANQLAAMPSLHFAWAAIVAAGFITIRRSRWSLLMVLHPLVTLLAIVATANHYWLDAIVGGALVAVAIVVTHSVRCRMARFDPARLPLRRATHLAGPPPRPTGVVAHRARLHRSRCVHRGRSPVGVADRIRHLERQIRSETAAR
jgi:hypothetical protein